jgi:PAS domain S-box-containing protein
MANLALLIADMWVLGILILLFHHLTPRFGFAPLLLSIGALAVLVQIQGGVYIEPSPGFIMFVSSNVLIPVVLMSILVLYIANGAVPCRMTIFGVIGLTFLAVMVLTVYRLHLSLPGGGNFNGEAGSAMFPALNPRVTLASIIAFGADMFAIAVIYQGAKNVLPKMPEALLVGLALLAALWTDAIVFGIISDLGTSNFLIYLPGDLVGKTFSALILWPVAAFYLTRIAPLMGGYVGGKGRPTFDVLFGSLEAIKVALVRTEKALHQAEVERRQQDTYFRQISENIREALWLTTVDSIAPLFVNEAYAAIWGRSTATIYADGDTFINSIHPEDRDRVVSGLPEQKSGGYDVEYRIIRPDGTVRWVRDRAFPISDDEGVIYRVAGITEDVTEFKQTEKDRLDLAVEREKVNLLRDFIGEFSHDLKAPLTAINLKSYQLARSDDPQKRLDYAEAITHQTGHMSNIIDNLLTLARLDSAGDMLKARVDVNHMIQEICDGLRPQIEEKNLELVLDLAPDAPALEATADDLARAVANLIDNAVHYTPSGGLVRVQTEMIDHEAIIRVSDTGIGIPKEDQARIFDRFFRASNARTADPAGTGLGLAIVKKIVEQHEGRIEADSAVGSGTTFSVYLPVPNAFSPS